MASEMSSHRAATTKRARFCVTPGLCSMEPSEVLLKVLLKALLLNEA
jgi:hypothetical protein